MQGIIFCVRRTARQHFFIVTPKNRGDCQVLPDRYWMSRCGTAIAGTVYRTAARQLSPPIW